MNAALYAVLANFRGNVSLYSLVGRQCRFERGIATVNKQALKDAEEKLAASIIEQRERIARAEKIIADTQAPWRLVAIAASAFSIVLGGRLVYQKYQHQVRVTCDMILSI